MHLSTKLDCDLVAVEQTDELTLLVELTAPAPVAAAPRQSATLQVVLDRSGSMGGERLDGAKIALLSLIDRLDPTDNFGLVAFDDQVQVVVPAGPLSDKPAVKRAIAAIDAGGSTDLSSGYLRGLQEGRRVAGPAGATLLIVSDGHANAGIVDPAQLARVAVEAQTHRITTSTLGFGLGYDEVLLAAIARGGAGNELFAEEADTAVALIGGEIDGLLTVVAQAASLRLTWTPQVAGIEVLNDLPVVGLPDGAMLELGSFYGGETRRLLIKLHIPGIPALGLAQVATLEFVHVALPDVVQHTTTMPVHVNVVPGDQAAGRVPDPQVRTEALFQQTQKAKRDSSQLLSEGRVREASALLHQTSSRLRADAAGLPDAFSVELNAEASVMDALAAEAQIDYSRAAKISSYSASIGSRNRGRTTRGGNVLLRWAYGHENIPDSTLTLAYWELQRLRQLLPPELAAELVPSQDVVGVQEVAGAIAAAVGSGHPAFDFFSVASLHGGFTVERV